MSVWSRIKGFFTRSAAPAAPRQSFLSRLFRRGQTQTPPKDAAEYVSKTLTDKEIQNRNKYNSFRAGNPDMQLSYAEWDTMVTTLGTMGDTIEKFGYEAYKQLINDMHEENISLSSSEMSYFITETLSQIRSSDKIFSSEDAIDLLQENIYSGLLEKATR